MGYGTRVQRLDKRERCEFGAYSTVLAMERAGILPAWSLIPSEEMIAVMKKKEILPEKFTLSEEPAQNGAMGMCNINFETAIIGDDIPQDDNTPSPFVQRAMVMRFTTPEAAQRFRKTMKPYCHQANARIGMVPDLPGMFRRTAKSYCQSEGEETPGWRVTDEHAKSLLSAQDNGRDVVIVHKNRRGIEQAFTLCQTALAPEIARRSAWEAFGRYTQEKGIQPAETALEARYDEKHKLYALEPKADDPALTEAWKGFITSLESTGPSRYLGVGRSPYAPQNWITAHSVNKMLDSVVTRYSPRGPYI